MDWSIFGLWFVLWSLGCFIVSRQTRIEDKLDKVLERRRLKDWQPTKLLEDKDEDTKYVKLEYPRSSEVKYVAIKLMDIRAADNIRISYDFDRDGWVIEQASIFEWDGDDKVCDPDWQEVAFIKAWAREKDKDE